MIYGNKAVPVEEKIVVKRAENEIAMTPTLPLVVPYDSFNISF